MKIKEIVARYFALYTTAKRYHWKTSSQIFQSDHLLFDEVAGAFDLGLVDELVENYYMYMNRGELNDVDTIYDLATKYKGAVLEANGVNAATAMANELKRLAMELQVGLVHADYDQEVSRHFGTILDDISGKLAHALVLLNGRTAFGKK